ncbi:MAG: hypothetical protein O9262_15140 [Cyclobacteriaceae bacterium]|nr:hypothetical protein [Cyclobacteriaceae bacterium]
MAELESTPTSLVIEYKVTSLVVRAILSIVIISYLLIAADALSNILAVILLGVWFLISMLWLRKAFLKTALIITDAGLKVNDKINIQWNQVYRFYIKTSTVDGQDAERIIINSDVKDFDLAMEDLDFDREGLNRWIRYYNQSLVSHKGR